MDENNDAETQHQKPHLVQAVLTPDNKPIGLATDVESCTIRVEREFVDSGSGSIPVWNINDEIRERIKRACDFTSDAADEYWDIQLLLRTDVSNRERFRMALESVHYFTGFTNDSVPYSKEQPLMFTPKVGTDHVSVAALMVPDDAPPTTMGHFIGEVSSDYGLDGKELFDSLLEAGISEDPSLPDQFLQNPLKAQERFYEVLRNNKKAIRDASLSRNKNMISVDEV